MKVLRRSCLVALMIFLLTPCLTYGGSGARRHYDKGVQYASEGKFIQALVAFKEALKLDPGEDVYRWSVKNIKYVITEKIDKEAVKHNYTGIAYANEGKWSEAILEYLSAAKIEPNYYDAVFNTGAAYEKKGQYFHAAAYYNSAIKIDPNDAIAYYNRGNSYNEVGYYDLAISDLSFAIQLDPKYAAAYDNRGFVYMEQLKKTTKACRDFKRACELGACWNYNIVKIGGYCR